MFAILGSGFGLYGYLPALADGCGQTVVLPERYRLRYQARAELARFSPVVRWMPDENAALGNAVGVALVLRPIDQEIWIERCLSMANLKYLLLEKPLARTPELAHFALNALIRSDKVFKIGYIFRFTTWGKQLLSVLGTREYSGTLSIHWSFCAYHYQHDLANWKRFTSMGGGAIRFFGVHVIALLAQLGYQNVVMSRTSGMSIDEIQLWRATITGQGLPECDVMIDTRSPSTTFQVICSQGVDCNPDVSECLTGPFDSGESPVQDSLAGLDQRTPILSEFCRTLWDEADGEFEWYQRTLDLWLSAEVKSSFELYDTEAQRHLLSHR